MNYWTLAICTAATAAILVGLEVYRADRRAVAEKVRLRQHFNTGRAWGLYEAVNVVMELPASSRAEKGIYRLAGEAVNNRLQMLQADDALPIDVHIPVMALHLAKATPDRSLS